MVIGVLVCIEPAFGLRPPSLLNKSGREAIVKTLLRRASNFTIYEDYEKLVEICETLSQYGSSGNINGASIVRHKASNTSVMLIGASRVGKAATPYYLIKGIKDRLTPDQWELVAHWGVVFSFLDNKPEQLFAIQGAGIVRDTGLSWIPIVRNSEGKLVETKNPIEESDIKPTCKIAEVDAIVYYIKEPSRKDVEVELPMPGSALQEMAVEHMFNTLTPFGSSFDSNIKEVLINTKELPIIVVRRPEELMEPEEFQDTVMQINDSLQENVLSQQGNKAIFASPKGNFKIIQLTPQNIEKYKEDIIKTSTYVEDLLSEPGKVDMDFSYVAIVDGEVVGHILCKQRSSTSLYLDNGEVNREYKESGIGNIFFLLIAKKAQERGIRTIETNIFNSDKNTKGFLFHRGFSRIGSSLRDLIPLSAEVSKVIEKTAEIMRESSITELENLAPITNL